MENQAKKSNTIFRYYKETDVSRELVAFHLIIWLSEIHSLSTNERIRLFSYSIT